MAPEPDFELSFDCSVSDSEYDSGDSERTASPCIAGYLRRSARLAAHRDRQTRPPLRRSTRRRGQNAARDEDLIF